MYLLTAVSSVLDPASVEEIPPDLVLLSLPIEGTNCVYLCLYHQLMLLLSVYCFLHEGAISSIIFLLICPLQLQVLSF